MKDPIYCGRLVSPVAAFSSVTGLDMAQGHDLGRFGRQALPSAKPLALATTGPFNGLPYRNDVNGNSITTEYLKYYYHRDTLGTITHMTDSAGFIVERYECNVFGKPVIFIGTGPDGLWNTPDDTTSTQSLIGNTYMFQGRRYDEESTLYYFRTRHYDPDNGRFIQRDKPGDWFDGGNLGNGFCFVRVNPLTLKDPIGFHSHIDIGPAASSHSNPSECGSHDYGPPPPRYMPIPPPDHLQKVLIAVKASLLSVSRNARNKEVRELAQRLYDIFDDYNYREMSSAEYYVYKYVNVNNLGAGLKGEQLDEPLGFAGLIGTIVTNAEENKNNKPSSARTIVHELLHKLGYKHGNDQNSPEYLAFVALVDSIVNANGWHIPGS